MGHHPTSDAPLQGKRHPCLGSLVPPSQRAKPARRSACCGVSDRSARPHNLHPKPLGSGPRPHAPRTGGRGWESAEPRTPNTQARGAPPLAASCRLHSTQSQLARARAVRLVTGPLAHTPRTHSQWVAGPVRTPRGRAVGRGRAPRPRIPTPKKNPPLPGRPCAAPTARKASSQERTLWGW